MVTGFRQFTSQCRSGLLSISVSENHVALSEKNASSMSESMVIY